MTRLYIVRHGQTKWNIESRAQGSKNIELTEKGREQAKLLAQRIKDYEIDCIYSSDLDRAFDTAMMIGKEKNLQVSKIEGLREMCFGEWEGLTNDKIKEDYMEHYTIWRNKPHQAHIPGGEKLVEVQKRGLKAIHEIITNNKNKNILIVSHGITIKTILLGILDIDLSNLYKIRQDNTCMNLIEYKDYGPVIVSLNDTAHLENIK